MKNALCTERTETGFIKVEGENQYYKLANFYERIDLLDDKKLNRFAIAIRSCQNSRGRNTSIKYSFSRCVLECCQKGIENYRKQF